METTVATAPGRRSPGRAARQWGAARAGTLVVVAVLGAACSTGAAPTAAPSPTPGPAATGPVATPGGPQATTGAPGSGTPTPGAVAPGDPPPTLEPSEPFTTDTVTLAGDGREIDVPVYIADTPELRARGLMQRESLPRGTGMLFTYPSPSAGEFWMRNTVMPLSIAFFADDGSLIETIDMEPCVELPCPTYGPDRPYQYALEVPQGWFDEVGVDTGWRLEGATGATAHAATLAGTQPEGREAG